MMLDLDPSIKKTKGADYFKIDDDLDEEWIKKHQAFLIEEQRQKITKKFEKENEKLASEGQEQLKPEVLEERLKVLKDMEKKFEKENKTGKVEVEGRNPTIEKLENNILKLEQRIETMTLQAQDKEDNKEVALGTSKIVCLILFITYSLLTDDCRITLTLDSLLSFRRGSTFPSRSSSRRHSARSSNGLSSLWTRPGNSSPFTGVKLNNLSSFHFPSVFVHLYFECFFFFTLSWSGVLIAFLFLFLISTYPTKTTCTQSSAWSCTLTHPQFLRAPTTNQLGKKKLRLFHD